MITTQRTAVTIGLLALTLPGCAPQSPWASVAVSMHSSPALEGRLASPGHERVPALNQFPIDAEEASITGSVLGDEARPDKRAKKQASCDRRQAVSVGMTREQVYLSCWGKPTSISASTVEPNKFQLLVYQGYDYVYLEDGIVKSVQVSSR